MLLEDGVHGRKFGSTALLLLLLIINLLVILLLLLLVLLSYNILGRLPVFVIFGDSLGNLGHVDVIRRSTLVVELLILLFNGHRELLLILILVDGELMG